MNNFKAGGKLSHIRPMKLKNSPTHVPHLGGLLTGHGGGRTDNLHIAVPHDSYIVPADVVSGLGQGNTMAGGKVLDSIVGGGKGFKKTPHFAKGGMVPIIAASGEYHVLPENVAKVGKGNLKHGHQILDAFVKHIRDKTVKTMKNLPGPKK